MALQRPREYTIEDFEAFIALPEHADRRFELIDGEIVEKVPTEEHGVIVALLAARIIMFSEQNNFGGRVAVEPRHKMPEDRRNSRIPDLAFTSAERVLPITRKGAVPQMPDLAVEVKSPDDSISLLRLKRRSIWRMAHAWCGWFTRSNGSLKCIAPMSILCCWSIMKTVTMF